MLGIPKTGFLDASPQTLGRPPGGPEVPFAILTGKLHARELLMTEVLRWHQGKSTLNLGTGVPIDHFDAEVRQAEENLVEIPFSACHPRDVIRAQLTERSGSVPGDPEI